MDKLVNCCFTTKKIGSDLNKIIKELRKAFLATEVTETLKIHVATRYIQQCLKFLPGDSLGVWSEQAGESIHREFIKFWDRYKINSIEDENYLKRLKKEVVEFFVSAYMKLVYY